MRGRGTGRARVLLTSAGPDLIRGKSITNLLAFVTTRWCRWTTATPDGKAGRTTGPLAAVGPRCIATTRCAGLTLEMRLPAVSTNIGGGMATAKGAQGPQGGGRRRRTGRQASGRRLRRSTRWRIGATGWSIAEAAIPTRGDAQGSTRSGRAKSRGVTRACRIEGAASGIRWSLSGRYRSRRRRLAKIARVRRII
jgi:hypothetical protein